MMNLQVRPQAGQTTGGRAPTQPLDPTGLFGGDVTVLDSTDHPRMKPANIAREYFRSDPAIHFRHRWSHVGLWKCQGNGRMFSVSETSAQCAFWMDEDGVYTYGADAKPIRIGRGFHMHKWAVITIERMNATRIQCRMNGHGAITGEPFEPPAHRPNLILFSARGIAYQAPFRGEFGGGVWINRQLTNKERLGIELFYTQRMAEK